jgi:hypothetical protein
MTEETIKAVTSWSCACVWANIISPDTGSYLPYDSHRVVDMTDEFLTPCSIFQHYLALVSIGNTAVSWQDSHISTPVEAYSLVGPGDTQLTEWLVPRAHSSGIKGDGLWNCPWNKTREVVKNSSSFTSTYPTRWVIHNPIKHINFFLLCC